jgi:hypothetical protein
VRGPQDFYFRFGHRIAIGIAHQAADAHTRLQAFGIPP